MIEEDRLIDISYDVNEKKKNHTIFDLFKFSALRKNIIFGTINYFFCQALYFSNVFVVTQIGYNIYLNSILFGIAEILGYIISSINFF